MMPPLTNAISIAVLASIFLYFGCDADSWASTIAGAGRKGVITISTCPSSVQNSSCPGGTCLVPFTCLGDSPCQTDFDCARENLCCDTGCGARCIAPDPSKIVIGYVMLIQENRGCGITSGLSSIICWRRCIDSSQCHEGEQCCNGCCQVTDAPPPTTTTEAPTTTEKAATPPPNCEPLTLPPGVEVEVESFVSGDFAKEGDFAILKCPPEMQFLSEKSESYVYGGLNTLASCDRGEWNFNGTLACECSVAFETIAPPIRREPEDCLHSPPTYENCRNVRPWTVRYYFNNATFGCEPVYRCITHGNNWHAKEICDRTCEPVIQLLTTR